jgi:hypothetical protein
VPLTFFVQGIFPTKKITTALEGVLPAAQASPASWARCSLPLPRRWLVRAAHSWRSLCCWQHLCHVPRCLRISARAAAAALPPAHLATCCPPTCNLCRRGTPPRIQRSGAASTELAGTELACLQAASMPGACQVPALTSVHQGAAAKEEPQFKRTFRQRLPICWAARIAHGQPVTAASALHLLQVSEPACMLLGIASHPDRPLQAFLTCYASYSSPRDSGSAFGWN